MTYKHFTHGEIFTADDANNLMRQGRIIVADATERATISEIEGMQIYRLDTGIVEEYIGGTWRPYDTGWQALGLQSGWTPSVGFTPFYRRIGKTVYLRGIITYTGGLPSTSTFIGTLPLGYRPTTSHGFMVAASDQNTAALLLIGSNGQMFGKNIGTATAGLYLDSSFVSA